MTYIFSSDKPETQPGKGFCLNPAEDVFPVNILSEAHIAIQPVGRRVNVPLGENVFSAARSAGVASEAFCGGRGICGKCRVVVREGSQLLSDLADSERKFLSQSEIKNGYRLACQMTVQSAGNLTLEIPKESQVRRQRLSVLGIERSTQPAPSITKLVLRISPPTLQDVTADLERLLNTMESEHHLRGVRINYESLKKLPAILRSKNWIVTVVLRDGKEIVDVQPGDVSDHCFGFAVDIGTTKLAGYLVDLKKGSVVSTASMMNPQIPYGEDVITRISCTMNDLEKLSELQMAVLGGVNKLLSDACMIAGVGQRDVYDVVAVGNTAMHHIFFGIRPDYVALSPYPPALQSSINVRAKDVGLEVNQGAYVYSYPTIAGFVGADAVADIMATGMFEAKETTLLIDIGTNTEIVLGDSRSMISCSAASGPAFEGAHIRDGMRASAGAIEKVWINPQSFEPSYRVIDGGKPEGICGSGIVDAIAEMFKVGLLDNTGRMQPNSTRRFRRDKDLPIYVLANAEESASGKEVAITQRDVNEIQLAKSAIYSGTSILMKHFGVERGQIARVYLAGAFGTYVDPESARMIGMLPDVPTDRFEFAGNTAGSGARMALISTDIREMAQGVVEKTKYLELAGLSDFQEEFMKALYFPHQETERFPTVERLLNSRLESRAP